MLKSVILLMCPTVCCTCVDTPVLVSIVHLSRSEYCSVWKGLSMIFMSDWTFFDGVAAISINSIYDMGR
jgi:hypothetical protein